MRPTAKETAASVIPIVSKVVNDPKYMAKSRPLSVYYDISGKEHQSLAQDECFARIIHAASGPKYQIVVNRSNEVYLKDDDFYINSSQRFAKMNGFSDPYWFVAVTKDTLIDYVNYLKTGSLLSLRKAQSGV